MGRKRLSDDEKMTYVIGFKVRDELLEKINARCAITGETPGQWCRSVIEAHIK